MSFGAPASSGKGEGMDTGTDITARPVLGSAAVPPPARRWPIVAAVTVLIMIDFGVLLLHRVGLGRVSILSAVLLFALLVGVVARSRTVIEELRSRTLMIITAATALPGLFARPLLSDDVYRYVWDGHVQLAGVDPYHYAPMDPALLALRHPVLFPPGSSEPLINRPWVHTIYPPVAELWFTLVALVTPWRLGVLGLQIAGLAVVVATVALLARTLTRVGGRPCWALVYGACPATMIEAVNSAHVDALAALFMVAVAWAVVAQHGRLAGLFLGLAAGVKLVPLLVLPGVLLAKRLRWTAPTAVLTLVLSYLPHLVVVGGLVLGYLPGYLQEEGFNGQRRFALLIFLPEPARLPVALALSALAAGWALHRSRSRSVLITCCSLYGAAFLIATPAYPWYLLPMVVLALAARRPEWLILWPAAYLGYLHDRDPILQTVGYGCAVAVLVAAFSWRRRREGSATTPSR